MLMHRSTVVTQGEPLSGKLLQLELLRSKLLIVQRRTSRGEVVELRCQLVRRGEPVLIHLVDVEAGLGELLKLQGLSLVEGLAEVKRHLLAEVFKVGLVCLSIRQSKDLLELNLSLSR
jgi:hypothetical protein